MNTKSPKEAEIPLRGENHSSSDYHHHHHPNDDKSKASSSGGSAQWLRLKDPRIVRVSRALGGKDRHSKVCTVRGLRDRRVRLSVPTAIQLYDLQDRLGLNQPSKVVDWLLNAAKHEIDELPPLQIPPGSTLSLCQYPSLVTCNDNNDNNNEDGSASQRNEEDHREDNELSRPNHHHHSSFRGLLNTMPLGYNNNNINQWEQPHNLHSADLLLQAPQILVCPPGGAAQPYVPNSHHIAPIDMDPRQITQYQMLSSSSNSQNLLSNSLTPSLYPLTMSQSVKPFSLSMMTPNTSENQSHNKDHDFPSK